MSQENTQQPSPPPMKTPSMKERMAQQQQQPGLPPTAYVAPTVPTQLQQTKEQKESKKQEKTAKTVARASHFVDEEGIGWTRTGLTLPAAYWRGIVAYVNQAKLQWEPGEEKTTQQQLIVEAIGTWLNDHRSALPASVNAECDRVRETLRTQ